MRWAVEDSFHSIALGRVVQSKMWYNDVHCSAVRAYQQPGCFGSSAPDHLPLAIDTTIQAVTIVDRIVATRQTYFVGPRLFQFIAIATTPTTNPNGGRQINMTLKNAMSQLADRRLSLCGSTVFVST